MVQAYSWNCRNLGGDVKGKMQVKISRDRILMHHLRGGASRSSDEASVMEVEQRGSVIQLDTSSQLILRRNC